MKHLPRIPILSRLSAGETRILLALAAAAGAGLIFLHIVSEVFYEDETALDRRILMALRKPGNPALPIGPHWLQEYARDLTSLGSVDVLTLVVVAVVVFLLITRHWRTALRIVVAIAGGTALVQSLKPVFGRARPSVAPAVAYLDTMSFPSGHAALSAVTYLTLGALLARVVTPLAAKLYVMALAVLVTLVVGTTRVYLGFHWPSDVLGGWVLGAAWALACWAVAEWLGDRGAANE